MSNAPPVPESQTPPWPAQPAPREPSEEPAAKATRPGVTNAGMVAGMVVGSAAIAAALLYAGRRGRTKPGDGPKSAGAASAPAPETD